MTRLATRTNDCLGAATLSSGESLVLRAMQPEDEAKMVAFHGRLSEESVYLRYAGLLRLDGRTAHERLLHICHVDYDHERVLVAERAARGGAPAELIAVGRLEREPGTSAVEFALLVADAYQGQGLGCAMLEKLVEIARGWGMKRVTAEIVSYNGRMLHVCRKLGFGVEHGTTLQGGLVHAVKEL